MAVFPLYHVGRIVLNPWFRLRMRPQVRGLENLPRTGPAILASNHLSALDPVLLGAMLPRRVRFLAKSDFFMGGGLKDGITRWFFTSSGQLPMDRTGGTGSTKSLNGAHEALAEGELVGIFPEGTRSLDGAVHRGRPGVARLALATGMRIVPVGISGTGSASRKAKAPVTITIGKPIDVQEGNPRSVPAARALTDQVMQEIRVLCGLPYEHSYAGAKA